MDASCKIQGSIHVFRLVNNMCPGKWVHIKLDIVLIFLYFAKIQLIMLPTITILRGENDFSFFNINGCYYSSSSS